MNKVSLLVVFAIASITAAEINRTAVVYLKTGTIEGNLTFEQIGSGPVTIRGTITGLPDGTHGFHIHETGDISECGKAGGHYNPHKKDHGAPNATVRHVGDLGNIESFANKATVLIEDSQISLLGEYSIVGRSVVVHENADDLGLGNHSTSKTTGNAGSRLVCGVIGLKDPVYNWNQGASASPSISALSVGVVSVIAAILGIL